MIHTPHLGNHFNRTSEIEAFTRPNVQLIRNGVQLLQTVLRQVRTLGQVLANQTVDVLVTAALPRAVRIAKINRHARFLGQFGVFGHLTALVIGHAFTHFQRHAVQRRTEAFDRRGRGGVAHFDQDQITTGALNKRAHRRGIVLALDQVATPSGRAFAASISGGRT